MRLENIIAAALLSGLAATSVRADIIRFSDAMARYEQEKERSGTMSDEGKKEFFTWRDTEGVQHLYVLSQSTYTTQLEMYADENRDCVPDRYQRTDYSARGKPKEVYCESIVGNLGQGNIRAHGGFCPLSYITRSYAQYMRLLGEGCPKEHR